MAQLSIFTNAIIFLLLIAIDGSVIYFLAKEFVKNSIYGIGRKNETPFYILFIIASYLTFSIVGYIVFFFCGWIFETKSLVYTVIFYTFMIIMPTITWLFVLLTSRQLVTSYK